MPFAIRSATALIGIDTLVHLPVLAVVAGIPVSFGHGPRQPLPARWTQARNAARHDDVALDVRIGDEAMQASAFGNELLPGLVARGVSLGSVDVVLVLEDIADDCGEAEQFPVFDLVVGHPRATGLLVFGQHDEAVEDLVEERFVAASLGVAPAFPVAGRLDTAKVHLLLGLGEVREREQRGEALVLRGAPVDDVHDNLQLVLVQLLPREDVVEHHVGVGQRGRGDLLLLVR